MSDRDPLFSTKFLIFGVAFILLGVILLLRTTGYLPSPGRLWPIAVIVAGFLMLYGVHARNAGEGYVLFGVMFTLAGTFLLLVNTVFSTISLLQLWPILMCIFGVSIVSFGIRKEGNAKIALTVPGVAIIGLSLVFLPFSLGIANVRFRTFVLEWWPVLFLILGVALIAAYFRRKGKDESEGL